MRCNGTCTNLEIEIDEADGDIREAVVTPTKISIDWIEDDEEFFASLTSTDGVTYHGNFGEPILNDVCKMEGVKYTAADGAILFLASWVRTDTGYGGSLFFELDPEGLT